MVTRDSVEMRVAEVRLRGVGLDVSTPLPAAAEQMAATAVVLSLTAGMTWSRDVATLDRVLAHLRDM